MTVRRKTFSGWRSLFKIEKSAPKSLLRSEGINDCPDEDFFRKALTSWKKRSKNAKSAPVSWWRGWLFLRTYLVYSYDKLKSAPFESYSYHFSQEFKKTCHSFLSFVYLPSFFHLRQWHLRRPPTMLHHPQLLPILIGMELRWQQMNHWILLVFNSFFLCWMFDRNSPF